MPTASLVVIPTRLTNYNASKSMRFLRGAIVWLTLGGLAVSALAHEPGISTAEGKWRSDAFELTTAFAPADARLLWPEPDRRTVKLTPATFDEEKVWLLGMAPQLWEVKGDGSVISASDVRVELLEGDNVSFHLTFSISVPPQKIALRATRLHDLPLGHRQLVNITNGAGSTLVETLLSRTNPTLELSGTSAGTRSPLGFWRLLKLGIEHIWVGYDHLLFLLGLLAVCRTFRSVIAIVSCFTIAHSLTLALATLNVVALSPRLVEPAIAASIVFVGAVNIWQREGHARSRLVLTFVFGLIHGLGFAGVLRELGVGTDGRGILMPLFSFNLGVEVGQVFVAALALPTLSLLRKNAFFLQRGVPLVSGVVMAAGLYWLIERTFFFRP